uniref:Uncharacterized protein n=1 Tax=viral metagenome TaxID=1070528 RepID=A0A6M3L9I6_9ZZZZ
MAIVAGDILFKLSIKTGSAGNSLAQSDVNASLGKYISTTQITDATLNNLFDDVSGDENAASDVEYRCIFVHNAHATLTWQNVVAWLSAEVGGGANAAIAIDDIAASPIGQATAQADEVANENTAPTGEAFSSPTTKATGLALGNIAAGYCRAIWVKRSAANSAALNNDGVTVRCEGDTAA